MLNTPPAEPNGTILVGKINDDEVVKIIGHATWKISTILKEYQDTHTDDLLKSPQLVYDLTECTYIDSTMIGLISHMSIRFLKEKNKKAVLLYNSDKIKNIFEMLNCGYILDMVSAPLEDAPKMNGQALEPKKDGPEDGMLLRRSILLAHETLIELHESNIRQFTDIVKIIKKKKQ